MAYFVPTSCDILVWECGEERQSLNYANATRLLSSKPGLFNFPTYTPSNRLNSLILINYTKVFLRSQIPSTFFKFCNIIALLPFNLKMSNISAYRSLAGAQYKILPILGSGGEKISKNIGLFNI